MKKALIIGFSILFFILLTEFLSFCRFLLNQPNDFLVIGGVLGICTSVGFVYLWATITVKTLVKIQEKTNAQSATGNRVRDFKRDDGSRMHGLYDDRPGDGGDHSQ